MPWPSSRRRSQRRRRHEGARCRNPDRARLLWGGRDGRGGGGGEGVRAALERAVQRVAARATVKTVGCNGMCHCEPMVEVVEPGGRSTLYGNVNAEIARDIVRRHLRPRWLPAWQKMDAAKGGSQSWLRGALWAAFSRPLPNAKVAQEPPERRLQARLPAPRL